MRYRLSQGGTTLIETDVRIPVAATFAFAGARPSPAVGEIAVAFTLPAASPITLELFDLRGARVRHHVFGSMAAGSHVVAWPSTGALAPGLYVARLTSARGVREARVMKVR